MPLKARAHPSFSGCRNIRKNKNYNTGGHVSSLLSSRAWDGKDQTPVLAVQRLWPPVVSSWTGWRSCTTHTIFRSCNIMSRARVWMCVRVCERACAPLCMCLWDPVGLSCGSSDSLLLLLLLFILRPALISLGLAGVGYIGWSLVPGPACLSLRDPAPGVHGHINAPGFFHRAPGYSARILVFKAITEQTSPTVVWRRGRMKPGLLSYGPHGDMRQLTG